MSGDTAHRTRINTEIFKAYDVRGLYPAEINEEVARLIGRGFVSYLGAKRIGTPSEEIEAAILAINDFERLGRMGRRLVDPASEPPGWADLLATP